MLCLTIWPSIIAKVVGAVIVTLLLVRAAWLIFSSHRSQLADSASA